jgi:ABC-2 type transport system ATP-binding protein
MGEWHFTTKGDSTIWLGEVAGADRLRFFGVLARYSGLIDGFELGNSVNSKGADQ